MGKDSHSPSGMSPQQLGGSCELDCAAADVSSISASSECHSFGSGGVSKLKFEDDEPAVTEPVTKPSQPATKLKNGDMLDRNTRVRRSPLPLIPHRPAPRLDFQPLAASSGGMQESLHAPDPRILTPLPSPNQVIGVLGSGAFGTVYSSLDVAENKCVAVKVQRAGSKYTQVSLDEIHLLEEVGRARESAIAQHGHACGGDNVVELKAKFELGRPARQMCMSFEMLGPSILDLIIDHGYKGLPLPIVRQIARDCLNGLDFLHACDIVHTDVKPENVLLTLPEGGEEPSPHDGVPLWWSKNSVPSEGGWKLRSGWSDKLSERHVGAKLVDLGNSCFDNHHFTDNIQTIEYRSPEVVLGAGYSTSADVWSLACTIFELVTGEYLFDPHPGESYTREEDLLAHHQELLGAFPVEFALSGRQSPSFFDEQGNMWHVSDLRFWNLFDVLVDKYGWDRREAADFVDFLLPMLSPEPSQRATAADRLAHPWLAA